MSKTLKPASGRSENKMKVQDTVRELRLKEWALQIKECQESGLSVVDWCAQNGVGYKNYYYRLRKVREELLNCAETTTPSAGSLISHQVKKPVFAELAAPNRYAVAVTLRIGRHNLEIHNGADASTVESVLRMLVDL
jgi:hypothetical protein